MDLVVCLAHKFALFSSYGSSKLKRSSPFKKKLEEKDKIK